MAGEPGSEPEGGVEAPPRDAVHVFFGGQAAVAQEFARLLATSAVERGLIGPRELPRLWSRHLLNCAAVAPAVPPGASLVDVGSGAGLPGLVLAIARPDIDVLLVEPLLRRVSWLEEAVATLAVANVRILRGRAEEVAPLPMDVSTARAVAPLSRLAGWCLPLTRAGGLMLAIKGRSAGDELRAGEEALERFGARSWRIREFGAEVLEDPTVAIEVRKGDAGLEPRRRGHAGQPRGGRRVPRAGRPRS